MTWYNDGDLGRWLGFVRRSDGKTLIVWAYDDAKEARTPAEEALEWCLEYDFEDIGDEESGKLHAAWLEEQRSLATSIVRACYRVNV